MKSDTSKIMAVRTALLDTKWHHMRELHDIGGWRYGAVIHVLRRGMDGQPPMQILTENIGGNEYRYRWTGVYLYEVKQTRQAFESQKLAILRALDAPSIDLDYIRDMVRALKCR